MMVEFYGFRYRSAEFRIGEGGPSLIARFVIQGTAGRHAAADEA
jgi:hypothetical protein